MKMRTCEDDLRRDPATSDSKSVQLAMRRVYASVVSARRPGADHCIRGGAGESDALLALAHESRQL